MGKQSGCGGAKGRSFANETLRWCIIIIALKVFAKFGSFTTLAIPLNVEKWLFGGAGFVQLINDGGLNADYN